MSRIILFALVISLPAVGWAQTMSIPLEELKKDSTQPTTTDAVKIQQEEPKKKEGERVEVTGSRIKRLATEGVTPISTITRKDIEKTGYTSVSDVLRDSTESSFGGFREASGSDSAGNAYADVHGLGADHTLVLMNGQRLPKDAGDAAVDLNLIPLAAVERIEILKDGASALYGSDAMGGVINIITRKDFSGTQISISQTTPEKPGGRHRDINLVNGINGSRFNMVNVLQYRDETTIFSRDRFWTNSQLSPTGAVPSYRKAGSTDNWQIIPGSCPAGMVLSQSGDTKCQYNTAERSTQLPALQQIGVLSETNVEVSSRVKVLGRISASRKTTQWSFAPAPGRFAITDPAVASTLGPGGTTLPGLGAGDGVEMNYRTMSLGNRDNAITAMSYNAVVGTTVDLHHDWSLDVTGSHNKVNTKTIGTSGYPLTSTLQSNIAAGNCDPFDPSRPCNLSNSAYRPESTSTSQLSSFDVKGSGPLFQLPGGPLSLALGGTIMFERFDQGTDPQSDAGNVLGGSGGTGAGQRDAKAAYIELSIPVTKKLELQLAGREDKYSDFGQTFNPKAALLYKATQSLLLRTSVGTGFKAPAMQDLYSGDGQGFPWIVDHYACDRDRAAQGGGLPESCFPHQYEVDTHGNDRLKEERSISYTAGAVFEPNRDFNISTDFFLTKLTNVVGVDYDEMTRAESANPQIYQQSGSGITTTRTVSGGLDAAFVPTQNTASREVTGVDIAAAYRIAPRFKLSTNHSQLFWYKQAPFVGVTPRNILGEHGSPPWRNSTALTYLPGERHDISLIGLTTAGQQKWVPELGRINPYTTFALQYTYKSKSFGQFSLGVQNVLGSTPPLDDSDNSGQLNTGIYDQIGRQVYTAYTAAF